MVPCNIHFEINQGNICISIKEDLPRLSVLSADGTEVLLICYFLSPIALFTRHMHLHRMSVNVPVRTRLEQHQRLPLVQCARHPLSLAALDMGCERCGLHGTHRFDVHKIETGTPCCHQLVECSLVK